MTEDPGQGVLFAREFPPASVLVIVTRRIGDVLLATPLIRSIRRAWPQAALDALVFEGTQGVIEANPDLRRILRVPQRPGFFRHLGFVLGLARRYELALSLVPGDRPTLYAFVAGRRCVGLLLPTRREAWKRRLLHRWVPYDRHDTHTVLNHLSLAGALGIPAHPEIVVSWRRSDAEQVEAMLGPESGATLAVLHPYPKFNYKMWRREGWIEVAHWLDGRGYRIALTGSGADAELAYLSELARRMPSGTLNTAGKFSLGGTGYLLSRAALYVGPDTAVTHMAAALGMPTVCLYGPTDPVTWGPWPKGHAAPCNPWRRFGSQSTGKVRMLQGVAACVPCKNEGCERRIESFSDCLQALPAQKVIAAIRDVAGITAPDSHV
jgi:heptosyltransferase-3